VVALSVLDLAPVLGGHTDYRQSVELAQKAEALGFHRMWYAEHHNMPNIASLDPALMIAYIGAQTSRIGLAAGGVMLPNHVPFIIAEKFSMLAAMFPRRVLLGLGRAPGTDATTLASALRRSPQASQHFVRDVQQLQSFLAPEEHAQIRAFPTEIPPLELCILGSSLFGAQAAADLGLPYAFASHFAPAQLYPALELYRAQLKASTSSNVKVAVNVVAASRQAEAEHRFHEAQRAWLAATQPGWNDTHMNLLLSAARVPQLQYTAVGDAVAVKQYLDTLIQNTQCDELIMVPIGPQHTWRLETLDIIGAVMS